MTTSLARTLSPAQHLELIAAEVSQVAADFVRTNVGRAAAAATKSTPTDVVTETDRDSEQLIRQELLTRCPGSAIVGEEFDDEIGANDVGWIVDPIDGTVNFLYDLPVVSVSIAATLHGQVVAGAVTDILRCETFAAHHGGGARLDGRELRANGVSDLSLALIGTGFAYDAATRAEEAQLLTRLLPACRDIRCMGSAALNLCWVGAGRLDGFFERDLKTYDYAAGALIAAEAGAVVTPPVEENRFQITAAAPGIASALTPFVRVD